MQRAGLLSATALALLWPVPLASGARRLTAHQRKLRNASEFNVSNCGPAPKYEHALTGAKKTEYVSGVGHIDVTFSAGDQVEYKCEHGFSLDGSMDGERTFFANCSELGYFKPGGVCVKSSKCGTVPNISHALPTGKTKPDGSVEFVCTHGYSLDGKRAAPGGMGKNTVFSLKCIEFSSQYEKFEGECKPAAFLSASKIINMYNGVFNALFVVDCKASLKGAFGQMNGPPATLESACGKFTDAALGGQCSGLVAGITAEFETKEKALKDHLKKNAEENLVFNMSHPDKDRPSIEKEADTFCTELWALLELPQKDELPSGATQTL